MQALLDTGVWFRRYHRLGMKASLKKFLDSEVETFHLCTMSIAELTFKWRRGRLPGVPDPKAWLDHSIEDFVIQAPSANACLEAGLWDWTHVDLIDRTLAAIAAEQGLTLIHTDVRLKDLEGFPQRYFPNVQ